MSCVGRPKFVPADCRHNGPKAVHAVHGSGMKLEPSGQYNVPP